MGGMMMPGMEMNGMYGGMQGVPEGMNRYGAQRPSGRAMTLEEQRTNSPQYQQFRSLILQDSVQMLQKCNLAGM